MINFDEYNQVNSMIDFGYIDEDEMISFYTNEWWNRNQTSTMHEVEK